ncbi:GDP-mannose-dependent alpha-(1-6)-phosphatidylinositol monomannoside mannosyltransferase [Stieleria maiorica]|uniref:GDP-mannose-dependent alpha-(1-6)-phosphatidylinositol monomannoside mannosyltransferase n=1 Tax=Stieleria maiorica TaxID=2795974 RepID=A0A5B9MEZ8_9BACT|nr:glycosyltransferase family 4 protein [Stieleria maiorica]QEF98726.1 GDP-mannose-dependent alpha-(1-6)-phosphatidylinositol monomannoside mannosyltransferase [Stieleria maiorica]
MNVLFITSHLSPTNGWGKVAVETIRRFTRDGHQVTVLTDDPADVDCGTVSVVRVATLHSKEGGRTRGVRILCDLVQCRKLGLPDDVLIFCLTEDLLPLAAKLAKRGRSLVCFAHGTYAIKSLRGANRELYLKSFDRCDLILCNSKYTQQQLSLVANHEFAKRSRVAPLGCDQMISEEEYLRSIGQRQNLVIAVGQLKPRKAIVESIQAFHRVRERFPQYEFHVIGDTRLTDYVSQIEAIVTQLDLVDAVRLVGKVDANALRGYYMRAKLLLMPSINENDHFEGFGLVHLEANSWGTPSIGSTGCGHEQAINNGVSGLLTPQRDIDAIGKAMLEILGTERSWMQYSRQAYDFSHTMSWDNYHRSCLQWISEAVGRPARHLEI